MRQGARRAALLAVLLAVPLGLAAQAPEGRASGVTDAAVHSAPCDYDECTLRLWNSDVLEGRSGERVDGFGFFRPPNLEDRFARSDSAMFYLRVVEENYTPGRVTRFLAQVASTAGAILYFSSDETTQSWALGLQVVGFSAGWLGQRRVRRAEEAMSRAIWWYNRDVVIDSGQLAGGR